MARELQPHDERSRAIAALLLKAGPRSLPPVAPVTGEQVAPRASRPARGMHDGLLLRTGCRRIPRAGFRGCSLRSLRSLRPRMPEAFSAPARLGPRAGAA